MKPSRIFLAALGILLVGYAFLGRGFAYIGFPPLYVGEIVLALGLLCFLLGGGTGLALRSPISWLLLLYMSWGALRTYPYISVYGVNALRDAVIWSYGLFAFLVAAYVLRAGCLSRIPLWYGRVLPWFLVWIPIAYWVQVSLDERVKNLLVNGVPLFNLKAGDTSVHFAGAMAFLMLGLRRALVAPTQAYQAPKEWIDWMLWFSVVVFLISWSRGGFLTIAGALFLLVVFHPTRFSAGSASQFLFISIIAAVLLAIGFFISLEFDTGGARKVSVPQVISNIASIFSDQPSASGVVQQTKNWRLKWWTEIANYTVFGEYFWTGKGFGVNLAEADGFGTLDKTLRSPHSALFTTLAREGVPGLALWILLQVSFGSALMRAYFRARRLGQALCAKICFWVLTYWFAFLINASFDVFLEGPQGGIWFWSLFGFGIAVLETQRRLFSSPRNG